MNYLCSISIAKKSWKHLPKYGLKSLADHHQLSFNHHRAGDDAEVCAKIALLAFDQMMVTRTDEIHSVMQKNLKVL